MENDRISRHIRIEATPERVWRAGLVEARRHGREVRFVPRPARLAQARSWLDDVAQQWDQTLERLKARVEMDQP